MCSSSLAENNLPPPGGAVQTGAIVVTITSPFGTAEISASSEPVAVELHPPPAWTPMASPGVFISWPVRAVLPGSSFTARVYAYSPDKCVNEFLLPVFFDPSHVSLDFAEENQALYSPAVKVEDRLGQGVFSLSVQSAKSPSTCSQRRV